MPTVCQRIVGTGLPPVQPGTRGPKKECSSPRPTCPQPGQQKPETQAGLLSATEPDAPRSPQHRHAENCARTRDARRGTLRRVIPGPVPPPAARRPPSRPQQGTRRRQGWGRTQPLPAVPGAPRPPLASTAGGSRPAHPAQAGTPGRVPPSTQLRPAVRARGSRRDSLQLAQRLLPVPRFISAPVGTSTSAPSCHGFCSPPPQVLHLTPGKPELFWREGI